MVDWVPMRVGARPVPQPVATPLVWATASGGAVVLLAVHYALLGPGRPGPALAALCLLAALLGRCARFTAAPGTALLCWLLLNGFAIPPLGTLTWAGQRDALWLGCLCAATPAQAVGEEQRRRPRRLVLLDAVVAAGEAAGA
ncbi:hypothetical protein, partial [Streptomyces sp. NPDC002553]|uniref:hypothetical protein n=1 Tax=Streptomyces sp. NPDC002553 TaxID=3154417 RepID=UPI003325F1B2